MREEKKWWNKMNSIEIEWIQWIIYVLQVKQKKCRVVKAIFIYQKRRRNKILLMMFELVAEPCSYLHVLNVQNRLDFNLKTEFYRKFPNKWIEMNEFYINEFSQVELPRKLNQKWISVERKKWVHFLCHSLLLSQASGKS